MTPTITVVPIASFKPADMNRFLAVRRTAENDPTRPSPRKDEAEDSARTTAGCQSRKRLEPGGYRLQAVRPPWVKQIGGYQPSNSDIQTPAGSLVGESD